MLYLGVDPSLNNTGFCILDSNDMCVTEAWTVSPRKKTKYDTDYEGWRLNFWDQVYMDVCLQRSFDRAHVEGYAYSANGKIAEIAEAIGLLRLALYRVGKSGVSVPPTRAKKFCTGSGKATKTEIKEALLQQLGYALGDEHQNDALCLANYGMHQVEGKSLWALSREQRKATK